MVFGSVSALHIPWTKGEVFVRFFWKAPFFFFFLAHSCAIWPRDHKRIFFLYSNSYFTSQYNFFRQVWIITQAQGYWPSKGIYGSTTPPKKNTDSIHPSHCKFWLKILVSYKDLSNAIGALGLINYSWVKITNTEKDPII